MSGLIPPGKNAAERTANALKFTGSLPDGQMTFGNDDDKIRDNCKENGILIEGVCQLENDGCISICGTGRELYRRQEHEQEE